MVLLHVAAQLFQRMQDLVLGGGFTAHVNDLTAHNELLQHFVPWKTCMRLRAPKYNRTGNNNVLRRVLCVSTAHAASGNNCSPHH